MKQWLREGIIAFIITAVALFILVTLGILISGTGSGSVLSAILISLILAVVFGVIAGIASYLIHGRKKNG